MEGLGKKKRFIGFVIACVVIMLVIVGIFMFQNSRPETRYYHLLDEGKEKIEQKDYESAEEIYLKAVEVLPQKEDAYDALIDVYVKQDDYKKVSKISLKASKKIENKKVAEKYEEKAKEYEELPELKWEIEPCIDADDINYLEDHLLTVHSVKVVPYAVLTDGSQKMLIDMNKNIVNGNWNDISTSCGVYVVGDGNTFVDMTSGKIFSSGIGCSLGSGYYYSYDGKIYDLYSNSEVNLTDITYTTFIPSTDALYDSSSDRDTWLHEHTKKSAVYNVDSKRLVTDFIYEDYTSFIDGYAAVCVDGKWGYIDETGKEIVSCKYEQNEKFPVNYYPNEGYGVLYKNQEWSLIQLSTNKTIIPFGKYDAIRPVFEGKCWVKSDGKWGVIQLAEEKTEDTIFATLPSDYCFSSGAGAWRSSLILSADGSFTGDYSDSDMQYLSVSECKGNFTLGNKVSKHVYEVNISDFNVTTNTGQEEKKDDHIVSYVEPYGFCKKEKGQYVDHMYLIMPGVSDDELTALNSDIFKEYYRLEASYKNGDFYSFYNIEEDALFTSNN